ncbi:Hsp70 family protein [Thauera sinica]|uniref:Hsp70 family protein n=1 Tax=Thauera sinica TaxID=2665146 RepID=A0ABW1AVD9_9RHOO|nr:Hsp70 family protein [Thauera sp. K11]ATE60460.1 molecular chaperone DnaK [Thauera sp. K11]
MTRYTVGIDLGTSNTVVAFAAEGDDRIRLLPIEQLAGRGEVAARTLLPSVRYHPAAGELDDAELALPWRHETGFDPVRAVVGSFARELGAQVPGRAVASAKSWLSHAGVDRSAPILPWGAGEDVPKVSPVVASASYLAHVRAAWNARHPDAPLERQDVVLTVPASFDEGARALTVEAARLAGLPALRLLEEPQAAFHDWLFRHRHGLASELAQSRLVLVCDVGGGTTDLTLIQVEPARDGGAPRLTRIGVGDHLMLGGDNMDLALAHLAERRLTDGGERLSAARFSQLVQRCRVAKERLLDADAPERATVTLLGAGARLVGAARSVELGRDEVARLVVDGFLPLAGPDDLPQRRRAGIVEFGLPYPADPAITRHLAAFLHRHATAARTALSDAAPAEGALPVPDTLLLNGGVFRAGALSARIEHLLARWRGAALRVLHDDDPDVAVARGAVAFALVRAGRTNLGPGIGGGSARSHFLVLEDERGGASTLCVLPRGTEYGCEVELPGRSFALRLGQAVHFHLVSSSSDTPRQAGDLVDLADDDFVRLPALAARLPATAEGRREEVAVRLVTMLTEVGTLEMHCVGIDDASRRWQLAFQLRNEADADDGVAAATVPHPRLHDALGLIDRAFGAQSQDVDPKDVRQLRARLERLLGRREDWDLALLRTLFDTLLERARRRRRSAEHERIWLNLTGYCLRPGLGAALDDWRIGQLWALFPQGIQYANEARNWCEWWTLWRRCAGGLAEAAQLQVLEVLAGHLEHAGSGRHARDPVQGSYDDMVRLAASLERVPVMHRIEVGKWLLERLRHPSEKAHTWWAVGRVGARAPLYGSAHNVVPPDIAAEWLAAILALDWKSVEPAAFAAAQVARMTGDRTRDLPPAAREEIARRLAAVRAPQSWITMMCESAQLDAADQGRSFGESLPPGLKLI